MATGRVRPAWIPPSPATPGLFTYGVDVEADGNQDVSGIWWYAPAALPTGDTTVSLYVQATQTLLPGATATATAASLTAGIWNLILFPAVVTMTGGTLYVMVATTDGASGSEDPAGYPIDDPSNTVHLPGPGRFQAGAGPYPAASTWAGQHGLDLEMVEGEPITATLAIVLPSIESTLDAEAIASATLDLSVPVPVIELDADSIVSASLDLVIPTPTIDLVAPSDEQGGASVPCGWDIPTPPLCCPTWDDLSPAQQTAALDYASTILWAATGRRFGLCTVTVRPCGMKRCQDGGAEFFGYDWSGGTWIPYIFNGVWFNCACPTTCCCDPRCQVRLMGPVDSIAEVTIGGVVVPDTAYRVDDEHWLVRTDGDCWPQCSDMNSDDGDNVFTVTYVRGEPVPAALLTAAGTLACEWAKACMGADCRLSNRVTSLARNGVQIDMIDPTELLSSGMTGLFEVDALIRAYNPYGLVQRGRIYAPELRVPRTVTSA